MKEGYARKLSKKLRPAVEPTSGRAASGNKSSAKAPSSAGAGAGAVGRGLTLAHSPGYQWEWQQYDGIFIAYQQSAQEVIELGFCKLFHDI